MTKNLTINQRLNSNLFPVGVATSSFQIEGARDGREASIWDTFCATPGAVKDGSDGNVACDHIHRWQDDIELVSSLGFDAYRFSVSWPRIMKACGSVNQAGLAFYVDLLKALKDKGLKAYVTLYHWDLPQYLEDKGGWLNRETALAFAEYVDVVSKAFNGYVDCYATLNEPFCSAYLGYEIGVHAPGKVGKQFGKKAAHHLLLAHGMAMQVLRRNAPDVTSGIVLNFTPYYASTASEADAAAAKLAHDHHNDWYVKPVLTGCYPDILHTLPENEKPDIYDGDLALINAPLDYLGVNYYTRSFVAACSHDGFSILPPAADAPVSAMGWEIFPNALRDLLLQLHRDYDLPPVQITENGMACDDALINGEVDDPVRVQYLQDHMNAVAEAMEAGVDVTAYFVWSLLDNFEWAEGYLKRFGIVYVDYDTQQRIPKHSALALQQWLTRRKASNGEM